MSGRSCASGSVRSGAGSLRPSAAAGHEVVLDALYERDQKRDNKSVRVLTVVVYVFCVSLAAIMLSLYYVFFWEPKDAQYAQRKVSQTVKQQSTTTPMPTCFMLHTGGSSTTVNDTNELPPSSATYPDEREASETIDTSVVTESTQHNSTSAYRYNRTTEDIDTANQRTTLT